jgi:DNA-binding Lrp family transcriptional regulator
MVQLTPTDRQILDILKRDAKVSNRDLARQVGLAPSTCHGRVRALEAAGYITGYHASLNHEQLGLEVSALIQLRVRQSHKATVTELAEKLLSYQEVSRVLLVSGDEDLVLEVAAHSVADLRTFIRDKLGDEPAIGSNRTRLIFDSWGKN